MSGALPVALLLLLTLTVGYALALVVTRTREIAPRELAALCLALGLGAYPTLLLWASLAGLRPTRGLIAGIGIACALVAVSMHVRGRGPKFLSCLTLSPCHHHVHHVHAQGHVSAIRHWTNPITRRLRCHVVMVGR